MKKVDVRWQQRFENFESAFSQLTEGVQLIQQRPLTQLEKQGLIQAFEFTHELAWNVLKDYLEYQGIVGLIGSRDTSREAYQKGLISEGDHWMEMIKSRNLTSHTYNKAIADGIINKISTNYANCFIEFQKKMKSLIKS